MKKKNVLPPLAKNKTRNIQLISPWAYKTSHAGVMTTIGGFAGLYKMPDGYTEPVLVSASEAAGDKLKQAIEFGHAHTAGKDLVALCLNHVATLGASPLFFMDNIAFNQWDAETLKQIISGVSYSCLKSQCALLGGDTSVVPDTVSPNQWHINGFCVGVVEKATIVNPANIKKGDVIIGLPSSGIHAAGATQMMHIFKNILKLKPGNRYMFGKIDMLELLMRPVRMYAGIVEKLAKTIRINGIVHITEGGLPENLPRIMPTGLSAYIEKYRVIPELFNIVLDAEKISPRELYNYFNMGIGMVLILSPADVGKAEACFKEYNEPYLMVGEVRESDTTIIEGAVD